MTFLKRQKEPLDELQTQMPEEVKRAFEAMVASHNDEWLRRVVEMLQGQWSRRIEFGPREGERWEVTLEGTRFGGQRSRALSIYRTSIHARIRVLLRLGAPLLNRARETPTRLGACEEEAQQNVAGALRLVRKLSSNVVWNLGRPVGEPIRAGHERQAWQMILRNASKTALRQPGNSGEDLRASAANFREGFGPIRGTSLHVEPAGLFSPMNRADA